MAFFEAGRRQAARSSGHFHARHAIHAMVDAAYCMSTDAMSLRLFRHQRFPADICDVGHISCCRTADVYDAIYSFFDKSGAFLQRRARSFPSTLPPRAARRADGSRVESFVAAAGSSSSSLSVIQRSNDFFLARE